MSPRKPKEKVYFTVHWSPKHQTAFTKNILKKTGLILIGLFLILAIGIGSGSFKFAYGVASCGGLPVKTTKFIANTLTMPGEKGYGPSPFSSFNYCTREQAQQAGFGPFVPSESQKLKAEAELLAREEAKRYSPEKVPYVVYAPRLETYQVSDIYLSEIQSNIHTFMKVKKNGTVIGSIRQLGIDDAYNICRSTDNPEEDYCTVIGIDGSGREIKRNFHHGFKGWESRYVGIDIEGTGIILTSDDDAEAVQILSSLQKYTGEN